MKEIGCDKGDVVVKSDQEPAVRALLEEVGEVRAAQGGRKMLTELSPVYSSQRNGVVERAVRSVDQQARALRNALEERWRVQIPAAHAAWAWMIESGTWLLSCFQVG